MKDLLDYEFRQHLTCHDLWIGISTVLLIPGHCLLETGSGGMESQKLNFALAQG
jgi:hypothetical protein